MLAFKVLSFLFPFLKEIIMGRKKAQQSLVENKKLGLVVVLILVSVFLNFFFLPKLVKISLSSSGAPSCDGALLLFLFLSFL